jgi:hypothetical protein
MKIINAVKKHGKKMVIAAGGVVMASNAHAAVDLTGVTLDTTTPETLAATVLTGLGVIWGIRKLVKLVNRS